MSKIVKKASCGNEAQNADCVVTVEPSKKGIELNIESIVMNQFGDSIKKSILDELKRLDVTSCKLSVVDRGAIDCVLRARVEVAVKRGMEA